MNQQACRSALRALCSHGSWKVSDKHTTDKPVRHVCTSYQKGHTACDVTVLMLKGTSLPQLVGIIANDALPADKCVCHYH